jgi:predicted transcriptional regulator
MRASRSKPKLVRLVRILKGKYAVSVKDIARITGVSHRQAQTYVALLQNEGIIFLKYRQRYNYYALRRNE